MFARNNLFIRLSPFNVSSTLPEEKLLIKNSFVPNITLYGEIDFFALA